MKKLISLLSIAAALTCTATYHSIDISKEKTPCSRMSLLGLTAQAKRITLIDNNNTGSITMKIGRSATVTEYVPHVYTNITSKYKALGTTVSGSWYFASNSLFAVEMVRIGNVGYRTAYGDGYYRYVIYDYPQQYTYGTRTNSSGYVYTDALIFTKSNHLQRIHYDNNMNVVVDGEIFYGFENWGQIEASHGTAQIVIKETNQYSGASGKDCFAGVTTEIVPEVRPRSSAVKPANFIEPVELTRYTTKPKTITKEYTVCNTNYTGGILEYDLPANSFLMPDYYIKTDCVSMTNGTANIKLIYEK